MKKSVLFMLVVVMCTACSTHDERYYALHPKALQSAMTECPERALGALSCDQLKTIALRINQLAYLLREDQQGYGKKIISLQESRDLQVKHVHDHPNQPELKQTLDETLRHLEERLAVVKWLQSPEG